MSAPALHQSSRSGVQVLLVDDEPAITELLAMRLRQRGYRVHCVTNGAEALDWLRDHHADLVVSDLHMPLVGGMDLCRALASDSRTAQIPVLLMTADAADIGSERPLNLREIIRKPFSVAQIVTRSVEIIGAPAGRPTDCATGSG